MGLKARRPDREPGEDEIQDPILKAIGRSKHARRTNPGAAVTGQGAVDEQPRRGLLGLLRVLGPGLITGASDDDPSGIGTYSQVGSQFGYGFLWSALFTFPLMAAFQELCARIALYTGVGLGVALRRKFPRPVVAACIAALFVANTINAGADLGAIAAGGSLLTRGTLHQLWLVPAAAILMLGLQLFMTYERIFKTFKWLTIALFAYVITGFLVHPDIRQVVYSSLVPHLELGGDSIAALVAIFGTTISPYLFFWQASSEVDEMRASGKAEQLARQGIRRSVLREARADILVGMLFSNVVMFFIMLATAAVLHAHGKTGIATADQAAQALAPLAGPWASVLFALGLIGTGLLAVPILTASAAYAVREYFGFRGTLADPPWHSPTFYSIMAVATVAGVAINLVGIDPIHALFVTAIINGVVAPPLMVLIVLLGSDRAIMKSRTSGWMSRSLTWIATGVMSVAAIALLVTLVWH